MKLDAKEMYFKSVMRVQSCCFFSLTQLFFLFLTLWLSSSSWLRKLPITGSVFHGSNQIHMSLVVYAVQSSEPF